MHDLPQLHPVAEDSRAAFNNGDDEKNTPTPLQKR
jgi:hypothetical protein